MSFDSYQTLSLGDSISTQLSQEQFRKTLSIFGQFSMLSVISDLKVTTLDSLSQHGINMADIERVKSAGINTIKGRGISGP